MPKKHETVLDKVAHLIQQAEHFARHGEQGSAEAALARADALMTKHAIDAAMIASRVENRDDVNREKPESRDLPFVRYGVEFYYEYENMLASIARHCRCRVLVKPSYSGDRESASTATVVGFPTDLDYLQLMWNSVYFAFVSKLNPKWDPARTADENIKVLKEAGWKWAQIAIPANEHGFPNKPNDGRLKAAYKRQCKREGVEPTPHTQRHEAYRIAYADGFESMISTRLWRMRKAAEKQVDDTPGSALALRDRAADVDDAFFEMFPSMRPESDEEREARRAKFRAMNEELEREEEERRAKLTPAQRAAEDRRKEREERREALRRQREYARTNDDAGRRAGAAAASAVDLGGSKVGRKMSAKEISNTFGDSLRID